MAPNIPILENLDFFGFFGNIIFILQWVLIGVLIIGGMFLFYFILTYNIRLTIFPLYGSGKDGLLAIMKPKKNRLCWNRQKTAWRPLFPLLNKKQIKPFDSEYIYPGKNVFAFEFNGEYAPCRINVDRTEQQIRGDLTSVPYEVREWQSLQHKKNAQEYALGGFWNENKTLIIALLCSVALLAAALIFIYMSYKMAGAGRADISALTSALNNLGTIPGEVPK